MNEMNGRDGSVVDVPCYQVVMTYLLLIKSESESKTGPI